MSSFMDEIKNYQQQIVNAGNQNFDRIAEELFESACQDMFTKIKSGIKERVRSNPYQKNVSFDVEIANNNVKCVVLFSGDVERDSKDYVIRRRGNIGDWLIIDKREKYGNFPESMLVLKEIYVIQQMGGLINKRYAITLTPLGQRYIKRLSDLGRAEGIVLTFDAHFRMRFKGNTLEEIVSLGTSFSPKAMSLEEMARFCNIKMGVTMNIQ